MCNSVTSRREFPLRINLAIPLVAVSLAGYLQVADAQPSTQRTFTSAAEASRALFVAAESQEPTSLAQILGPNSDLTSSSDPDQDKSEREQFARKYRQMHRLVREPDGKVILYIGAENWPFPIPLVSQNGLWHYDADAGEQEVLYRRIGENETTAIELCHSLIASLKKPPATGSVQNPAVRLLNAVRIDSKPIVFHGYAFRLLSSPGSRTHGVVAYPTAYGSSGVMTFVVNDAGVVYQKDLGAGSYKAAMKMTADQTDSTWAPAEDIQTAER